MAATYRVVDILSNSQNVIFDYIIRPENNTLYKTFKQAFDAANNRISFHLPGCPNDILFVRANKKECDTTGGVMRQFRVGPDVECIVMIIRQIIHKSDTVAVRRSPRAKAHVNYVELLTDSDVEEEEVLPEIIPRAPRVKKEKVEEVQQYEPFIPHVVSAVVDGDPQNMFDDDM